MPVSDPTPVEFLSDPLSNITRIERRNLLFATTVGVLVSKAGLVPTQLSTLGITFSAPAQSVFISVVALTVFYFLFAFIVYGLADFLIWRKKYQDYLEEVERYHRNWSQDDQHTYDEQRESVPSIAWLYRRSKHIAFLRLAFEYLLPLIFGLYVIYSLLLTTTIF